MGCGGDTVAIHWTDGNQNGDTRWHQCKDKCDADGRCVAWTMKYNPDHVHDPGDCYLKKSAPWNNGNGWHEDTTTIQATGEMSNPAELNNDWKQCMYACKDTDDCKSYTYIKQDGVAHCYKKSETLPGEDGGVGFYTFTTSAVSGDKAVQGKAA